MPKADTVSSTKIQHNHYRTAISSRTITADNKVAKLVAVAKSTNFGTTKIGRQQDLFGLESAGGQKLSGVL